MALLAGWLYWNAAQQRKVAEEQRAVAEEQKKQADRILTSATNVIVPLRDQIDMQKYTTATQFEQTKTTITRQPKMTDKLIYISLSVIPGSIDIGYFIAENASLLYVHNLQSLLPCQDDRQKLFLQQMSMISSCLPVAPAIRCAIA